MIIDTYESYFRNSFLEVLPNRGQTDRWTPTEGHDKKSGGLRAIQNNDENSKL